MSSDLIEQYRSLRLHRMAIAKQIQEIEAVEKKVKKDIIDRLLAGEDLGSAVTLVTKDKPTVTDWPALYLYIGQHKAFELLQRRVTESAVMERWAEGEAIPGVGRFPVHDIKV
jgi:hypothetical protein